MLVAPRTTALRSPAANSGVTAGMGERIHLRFGVNFSAWLQICKKGRATCM